MALYLALEKKKKRIFTFHRYILVMKMSFKKWLYLMN